MDTKTKTNTNMSVQEIHQREMQHLFEQSMKPIDYQWEIKHHQQMHEAYERSLKDWISDVHSTIYTERSFRD